MSSVEEAFGVLLFLVSLFDVTFLDRIAIAGRGSADAGGRAFAFAGWILGAFVISYGYSDSVRGLVDRFGRRSQMARSVVVVVGVSVLPPCGARLWRGRGRFLGRVGRTGAYPNAAGVIADGSRRGNAAVSRDRGAAGASGRGDAVVVVPLMAESDGAPCSGSSRRGDAVGKRPGTLGSRPAAEQPGIPARSRRSETTRPGARANRLAAAAVESRQMRLWL